MRFYTLSLLAGLATAASMCNRGYEPCQAPGAGSGKPPAIGPDMVGFYEDVVNSVNGPGSGKRSLNARHGLLARDDAPKLCCQEPSTGIRCLLLRGVKISLCWDRFTTNYYFADGSYGSVTTGEYRLANGDQVNLIKGNYTRSNGETGSIYGADKPSPNLSVLPIPTQFTSKGVGTAIPGSELGSPATNTDGNGNSLTTGVSNAPHSLSSPTSSSLPRSTTAPPTTIPATTIPESTRSNGQVIPATTVSETVVPGATTGPQTVTGSSPRTNPTAPPNASSRTVGQLDYVFVSSVVGVVLLVACGMLS